MNIRHQMTHHYLHQRRDHEQRDKLSIVLGLATETGPTSIYVRGNTCASRAYNRQSISNYNGKFDIKDPNTLLI